MSVEANELMDELHIDQNDEETKTVQNIIKDAQTLIRESCGSSLTVQDYEDKYNPLFDRTVKTLATQMYYDRIGQNGTSKGLIMLLTHLRNEVEMNEPNTTE